jgi:hypothetical protein
MNGPAGEMSISSLDEAPAGLMGFPPIGQQKPFLYAKKPPSSMMSFFRPFRGFGDDRISLAEASPRGDRILLPASAL